MPSSDSRHSMSSCFLILANNNYTYIYIMKNSAHILGLDLGTNSVGWALLKPISFALQVTAVASFP